MLTEILQEVQDRLKAKEWDKVKEICRTCWGCPDEPLAVLFECLTEHGFFKVFEAIEEIRSQPPDERAIPRLGLSFVIDTDSAGLEQQHRARGAVEAILRALPSP